MKRILVVDDNPSDALIVETILVELGYQVDIANDGFAAIDHLTGQGKFDLVLVDLQMPKMSGMDLLQRAKRIQNLTDQKYLVVSARNQKNEVKSALMAGANDYIVKPIDKTVLTEKINQLINSAGNSFFEYALTADDDRRAFVTTQIEIASLSENGVTLKSNIAPELLNLTNMVAPLFSNAGITPPLMKILNTQKFEKGYAIKLTFVGITEADRAKIRTLCKQLWGKAKQAAA